MLTSALRNQKQALGDHNYVLPVMKKPTPTRASREIDAKAKELMQEFFDHVRDFQAWQPGQHDQRKIFEGWAIQKIAGLQGVDRFGPVEHGCHSCVRLVSPPFAGKFIPAAFV